MSHEKSETFEIDGRFLNVPMVGFKSDEEAIGNFLQSRPGVPGFKTQEEAIAAAKERSATFDGGAKSDGLVMPRRFDDPAKATFARDGFDSSFGQFSDTAVNFARRLGGGVQALLDIDSINRARGATKEPIGTRGEKDFEFVPSGPLALLTESIDAHTLPLEELNPRSAILTAEEANARFEIPGHLKFNDNVTFEEADILHFKKLEELRDIDIQNRTRGVLNNTAALSMEMITLALDPINLGALFIPFVRETRAAALVARFGTLKGRAIVGTIEGSLGTALLEPLALAGTSVTGADYAMHNAVLNVAFGSVFGAALHPLAGNIGDRIRAGRGATIGEAAPEVIEDIRAQVRDEMAAVKDTDPELATRLETVLSRVDDAEKSTDLNEFSSIIDEVDDSLKQAYVEAIQETQDGVVDLLQVLDIDEPIPGIKAKAEADPDIPKRSEQVKEIVAKPAKEQPTIKDLVDPETDLAARTTAVGQMLNKGRVDVEPIIRSDKKVKARKKKKQEASKIESFLKDGEKTPVQLIKELKALRRKLKQDRPKSSKLEKKATDARLKTIESQLDALEEGVDDLGTNQQPAKNESIDGISETKEVKKKSTRQPKDAPGVIESVKFIEIDGKKIPVKRVTEGKSGIPKKELEAEILHGVVEPIPPKDALDVAERFNELDDAVLNDIPDDPDFFSSDDPFVAKTDDDFISDMDQDIDEITEDLRSIGDGLEDVDKNVLNAKIDKVNEDFKETEKLDTQVSKGGKSAVECLAARRAQLKKKLKEL